MEEIDNRFNHISLRFESNEDKMEKLSKCFEKLENMIESLQGDIKHILLNVKSVDTSCSRMNDHITFVEQVYNRFILSPWRFVTGTQQPVLLLEKNNL